MKIQRYIKFAGSLSTALALAALATPASAWTDCAGFPQNGATSISYNKSGCSVQSAHRGNKSVTPNNRNVVVAMVSNSSGGSRRVLTLGTTGGAPIGISCIAQRTTPGSHQTPAGACSAAVLDGIRMHIQYQ